jgi:transcriptional regulator with XRE-family HTH domain
MTRAQYAAILPDKKEVSCMSRFSHSDPRYTAALVDMGRNLQALIGARDWTQADLVRAAQLQMPIDPSTGKRGRMGADNISNMVNGKRRPSRVFVKAVAAALDVEETAFMPAFLGESHSAPAAAPLPILSEVPGKHGIFRVVIDREFPLEHALKIIAAMGMHNRTGPPLDEAPAA